jgi:sulfatase modifying factor 1
MKLITPKAGQPKPPRLFWIVFLGLLGISCHNVNGSVTNINISLQSQGDTYLIAGLALSYFAGPTFDTNYAQTWQGATNCADISFSQDLSESVATNWSPASIGDDSDGTIYASGSVSGAFNALLSTQLSPSGTLTISSSLSLNPSVTANSEGPGVGWWSPWSSADTSGVLSCNIISDGTNPTPYQLQYTVSTSQTQSTTNNWNAVTQSVQIAFYTNNIAVNGPASGKVIGLIGDNHDFVVSGDAAANVIWAEGDAQANLDLTVVLTLGPPTGDLILHALEAEALNFAPSDGIDEPLIPLADPTVLATQPIITGGLVADGVTPLLVELNFGASLPTTRNYTITLGTPVGGTAPIQIATINGTGWQDGNSLSVQAGMSNAFFYIKPVDCEDLQLNGSQELTVGLSLQDTSAPGDITATNTIHVRKPPIALIHGYNSDPSAWSTSFTSVLTASRPQEFVIAVGYGTNNNNEFNTSGRLDDLSSALDSALQDQVEQPLMANWAFTRYDVVGHSQGGVLARMLCQNLYPFTSTPIVSEDNFFRGRFRRVITIGAPHNGSVLLHYALQMKTNNPDPTVQWLVGCLGNLLQDKFDPFGLQIAEINNLAYPVDPRIKFFCLATAIYGGNPPDQITPCRAYWALGLRHPAPGYLQTRGQILLPEGSDGVVDYESQLGGAGTPSASIDIGRVDIAHADDPDLFATAPGMSQTKAPDVASVVIARLDGAASAFGPFNLPSQLSAAQRKTIDSLAVTVTHADIVSAAPGPLSGKTFYYNITPPTGFPISGTINWFAQVYGTNGLSTNGLDLQVSDNDTNASITVDDSVIGEVVIYAAYFATNGTYIVGNPVPVVSHLPSALLNIDLQPSTIALSPGDSTATQLWGVYTNNLEVLLFLTNGQASYVSSMPNVATVDDFGTISIQALGTTVVTATYAGYSANTIVSTFPPVVGNLSISTTPNGIMQLAGVISPGTTNILEASTDLTTWVPLATLISTNKLVTLLDNAATNYSARFYRLILVPALRVYTIILSASPSAGGTVSGGGTFIQGSPQTVTATATYGYEFIGWSGDASGTNNPLTITVTSNLIITANFSFTGAALVPTGTFTMGDTLDGESDAIPTVSVNVSEFYMDVNLVSYSQWQLIYNWATTNGYSFDGAGSGKAADHPVQSVDWYDTVIWCNARSEQAGLTPVYYTDSGLTQVLRGPAVPYANWTASGFRLPTEAEWEKAARSGLIGQRFPWGNDISESLDNYDSDMDYSYDLGPIGYNAAFATGAEPYTSPVGYFAPNGYGLYDMAGNVFEWCWDWYATLYAGGTDPHGPASPDGLPFGGLRVLRGDAWDNDAYGARCANRGADFPSSTEDDIGFRCVRGQ